MNNLQYIIENDTKAAMHMAVELCEQGDFDNVTKAFKWLMQQRDDTIRCHDCKYYEPSIYNHFTCEPPYDELIHCLENDWNISASWDGLRKFWCIELTEEGVKLRDAVHGTLSGALDRLEVDE